jgi:hypothetical protein
MCYIMRSVFNGIGGLEMVVVVVVVAVVESCVESRVQMSFIGLV